jgi:asparagine synthase (glutamine-hydrolysing)
LSGDGGDELFGGYAWYKTAQSFQTAVLPGWTARAGACLTRWPGRGLLRRLGKVAQFLAASPGRRHAWLRQTIAPEIKDRLYTPAFRARVQDHALDWLADYHDSLQLSDPLNRMMATDLATYMADDLLVKVDRMTMAHALECRSPLLDTDLVSWVLSLPSNMKLPGRRVGRPARDGKLLLREAVRNRFPAGFLERPKQGFSVPLERWFQQDLRGVVTERVLHGPLGGLGLLQPEELQRAVDAHFKGAENHASMIWALLVLATWAERTGASA